MKRIMLLLALAAVMATMLVYTGVAWAEPTSCISTVNANPSGGGNAEPGQTGDRVRTHAEPNHEVFGQGTADSTQFGDECFTEADDDPPGAFDPKQT